MDGRDLLLGVKISLRGSYKVVELVDLLDIQSRPEDYSPVKLDSDELYLLGFHSINPTDTVFKKGTIALRHTEACYTLEIEDLIFSFKYVHELQIFMKVVYNQPI